MQAAIEKLEGLERRLKVSVPVEQVEKAYQARLKKVAKTIKLDGFRPGKVPAHVVESRYAEGIRQEIAGELLPAFTTFIE